MLHSRFIRSCEAFPDRPAIEVGGQVLSYQQLFEKAASLAATVKHSEPQGSPSLTAVFAYRSQTAYAGILASLLAGHGYVPLNRTFPADRTRIMLERSGCRTVIVDAESAPQLEEILQGFSERLVLILPEQSDVRDLAKRCPTHRFLGKEDLEGPLSVPAAKTNGNSIAYLLFTSGSTGIPKGVMVSQRNVGHFVDVVAERYQITEQDRFSQTFDMTFDLSAFDMFVAWERGACVCCPSQKSLINPGRFIQDSGITVWFSVPSVGFFMRRLGALKPGRYPTLRWSLFCGEPLPADVAEAWAAAAPNSIVENLYGPTELTIACTVYRWNPQSSPAECARGLVPIGTPFPGMDALVGDENLQEVPPGMEGELLMGGPQVSLGYYRDPEKTRSAFVVPPGKDQLYYRTGDRVRWLGAGAPMIYLGRTDTQIKVQGHRVELGEVEAHLRHEAGGALAIALGWPLSSSGAEGIVAFVDHPNADVDKIREKLKTKLPSYAVPREIHLLPALPLNPNGKVDRKALFRILEEQA